MIEKLDKFDSTEASIYHAEKLYAKVNQLVDAVNELQESQNTYWTDIAELKKELQTRAENVQPDAKIRSENVQDKFAEQRKWIGQLCKFWDDNSKIIKHFGILTRIDETAIVRYEAENGFWYCACEPVKPDDNIIYKGDYNER